MGVGADVRLVVKREERDWIQCVLKVELEGFAAKMNVAFEQKMFCLEMGKT